jgi:hypothetical protein
MNIIFQIFILIIVYIIILGTQYKFYHSKSKKHEEKIKKINEEIDFNEIHGKELEKYFYQELSKRKELLKTMSYTDWIEYNQKNIEIDFKGRKYYFSIWRHINNMDRFILKCYKHTEYLNDDRDNLLERIESHYVYGRKHKPSKDILKMIYNSNEQPYGKFEHFWIPREYDDQIRKISISLNYDDEKGNQGVIILSYIIHNASKKYFTDYLKTSKNILFPISIFIFIFSIILLFINKNNKFGLVKSILFMLMLNIYIFTFIMKDETDRSIEGENKKDENINSGILSVSFLVGVNIFIIGKLDKEKEKNNNSFFLESAFLFILVLISLLLSSYKNTNSNVILDITKQRLRKELFFNITILLNIYIIINFGFYIFFGKKIIKS